MKTIRLTVLVTMVSAALAIGGDFPTRTVLGAAIGAGVGYALSEVVDGVDANVAAPALAVAGGLVGYGYDRDHRASKRAAARSRSAAVAAETQRKATAVADLHPGVDLIKVSIVNSNGVRTDVPVLRTGDKFVGPQGEIYTELPTAAVLAAKYGM